MQIVEKHPENNRYQRTLDRIDKRILNILQYDNLIPHRVIADKVGLSTPAVTRRLKRLRQDKFIKKDVSILNCEDLGRPLKLIVQVTADSELIVDLDKMRENFLLCPQIQQCYYVTGDADFILVFNVSDMAEYEKLTRNLFFEGNNVSRFTTFVSMQTIKDDSLVLLDERAS